MKGLAHYEKVERPWGNFERFTNNEQTTVKILHIFPGQELSLQMHEERDEFWRVLKGSGSIHIEDRDEQTSEGDNFFIPRYAEHRARSGSGELVLLEISFGTFSENDEKRFGDDYGRA